MIGENWNTLVAPPTERELDAAMAAVRVRALEHWKRRVWRGRALVAVGYVAVALAAGYAGWSGAAFRTLESEVSENSSTAWPPGTVRSQVVRADGSVSDGVRRYRITAWSEVAGERILAAESFVESEHSLTLTVSASFENAELSGNLNVRALRRRADYGGYLTLRRRRGVSANGLAVFEEGLVPLGGRSDSGLAALLTLFAADHGDRGIVRIEGPFAPPPTLSVRWIQGSGDVRYANTSGWMIARAVAYPGTGVRVRAGTASGSVVLTLPGLGGLTAIVPGLRDSVSLVAWRAVTHPAADRGMTSRSEALCVGIVSSRSAPPERRFRQVTQCVDERASDRRVTLAIPGHGDVFVSFPR